MSDAEKMPGPGPHERAREVLAEYAGLDGAGVEIAPLRGGLINTTYLVRAGDVCRVLQRVNPIFSPRIHENIRAVTEHLAGMGMVTPRLVPTRAGAMHVERGDLGEHEVWRLMSYVPGACFDVVGSLGQAGAAGELVGRFHAALEGLEHAFVDMRVGVHDTPAHLAKLERAVAQETGHRLHGPVAALAEPLLAAARALEPLPPLPERPSHGDLKLANVRFAGPAGAEAERALCLIDLDTVGPMHLGYEIGDALRSWCNPGGEDRAQAVFDLEIHGAAVAGYAAGRGRALSEPERLALMRGVEWVSLELAARFAADALLESYFGWDASRYPGRGEHNLARARSQWALFAAVADTRAARARQLGLRGF